MKLVAIALAGAFVLAGVGRAQQTQVLVQNEQIKVEATTYPESCSVLRIGKEASNSGSTSPTCTELAITNNSKASITAWLATAERDRPGAARKVPSMGIHAEDSVLLGEDHGNNPAILPRDTHRVTMGNPTRAEFKAAIFEDGAVFGEPEWVNRIVQNRRQVYRDVAEALQKLRAAEQAGTPRDQIIQELRELERNERAQDLASHQALAGPQGLILPRLGIYGTVAGNLERWQTTGSGVLSGDLNRLDTMLLGIANRLLVSKPPITDHPVPLGEPLDSTVPPGSSQNPAPTH